MWDVVKVGVFNQAILGLHVCENQMYAVLKQTNWRGKASWNMQTMALCPPHTDPWQQPQLLHQALHQLENHGLKRATRVCLSLPTTQSCVLDICMDTHMTRWNKKHVLNTPRISEELPLPAQQFCIDAFAFEKTQKKVRVVAIPKMWVRTVIGVLESLGLRGVLFDLCEHSFPYLNLKCHRRKQLWVHCQASSTDLIVSQGQSLVEHDRLPCASQACAYAKNLLAKYAFKQIICLGAHAPYIHRQWQHQVHLPISIWQGPSHMTCDYAGAYALIQRWGS